jgi:hypothetical protein
MSADTGPDVSRELGNLESEEGEGMVGPRPIEELSREPHRIWTPIGHPEHDPKENGNRKR